MATKNKIGKASEAARAVSANPQLQRLLEDEDLRGSLQAAYESARSAYGRLHDGKPATKALLKDKKLKRELAEAAAALREVSDALKAPPKRRRRGPARALVLLALSAGLALIASESLRAKVLDALFGAEEEYDYSSTTMPAQDAPGASGASSS